MGSREGKSVHGVSHGRGPGGTFLVCPSTQTGLQPSMEEQVSPFRWFTALHSLRPRVGQCIVCGHEGALNWESGDLDSRDPNAIHWLCDLGESLHYSWCSHGSKNEKYDGLPLFSLRRGFVLTK